MLVLGGGLAWLHLPECGNSLQEDVLEDIVDASVRGWGSRASPAQSVVTVCKMSWKMLSFTK